MLKTIKINKAPQKPGAKLIKEKQPKYNPKIFITHQIHKFQIPKYRALFGFLLFERNFGFANFGYAKAEYGYAKAEFGIPKKHQSHH